jgi:hypothetical protein
VARRQVKRIETRRVVNCCTRVEGTATGNGGKYVSEDSWVSADEMISSIDRVGAIFPVSLDLLAILARLSGLSGRVYCTCPPPLPPYFSSLSWTRLMCRSSFRYCYTTATRQLILDKQPSATSVSQAQAHQCQRPDPREWGVNHALVKILHCFPCHSCELQLNAIFIFQNLPLG